MAGGQAFTAGPRKGNRFPLGFREVAPVLSLSFSTNRKPKAGPGTAGTLHRRNVTQAVTLSLPGRGLTRVPSPPRPPLKGLVSGGVAYDAGGRRLAGKSNRVPTVCAALSFGARRYRELIMETERLLIKTSSYLGSLPNLSPNC